MNYMKHFAARAAAMVIAVFTVALAGAQAPVPAMPFVRILSPAPEQILPGPDVVVQFEAGNMCFSPCGDNLHFSLDNEPFEVQFDANHPHRFHDVAPGTHTVRVWAANKSHEAIEGTLDVVTFSVAYPDEDNRPEFGEPLLTYNLPQGEYRGIDGADVAINFLVSGIVMSKRGYHVNYYVDGRRYVVYDCNTRHVKGLAPGFHTVKVELVDEKGRLAPGPFNRVERTISIAPDKEPFRVYPGDLPPEQPVVSSIHGAMTLGQPYDTFIETPIRRARRKTTDEILIPKPEEGEPKAEMEIRRDAKPIDIQPSSVPSRGQELEIRGPDVTEVDDIGAAAGTGTVLSTETGVVEDLDTAGAATVVTRERTTAPAPAAEAARTTRRTTRTTTGTSPLSQPKVTRRRDTTTATLQTTDVDGTRTVTRREGAPRAPAVETTKTAASERDQ